MKKTEQKEEKKKTYPFQPAIWSWKLNGNNFIHLHRARHFSLFVFLPSPHLTQFFWKNEKRSLYTQKQTDSFNL